jgi:DOPA 4,5-dioxygenase
VPWLMFNRQGLNILIHPLTDDEVEDHTEHAVWLGAPVGLLHGQAEAWTNNC